MFVKVCAFVIRCVEKHQELQNSLTRQEDQVVSLQNMVVIVEDGVQDTSMILIYIQCTIYLSELGGFTPTPPLAVAGVNE